MEIKHKRTGKVLLVVKGSTLRGADLRGADLRGADLDYADMEGANLQGAELIGASLKHAKLSGVNLTYSNLREATLTGANLCGTDLRYADLHKATLPVKVIQISGMWWDVTIVQGYMRIGCQYHHVNEWDKFTDDEIDEMDAKALEFWQENKQWLVNLAKSTIE